MTPENEVISRQRKPSSVPSRGNETGGSAVSVGDVDSDEYCDFFGVPPYTPVRVTTTANDDAGPTPERPTPNGHHRSDGLGSACDGRR